MKNLPLLGRTALVTGAGTRLGASFALALAEAGCDVVVHYFRSEAGAKETAQLILQTGRKAALIQADLRESSGISRLSHATRAAFGRLDILINNASTYPDPNQIHGTHDLKRETFESFDEAIAVNVKAPLFLIQQLSGLLEESTDGTIINILDRSVSAPFLSRVSHSISKAALQHITLLASQALFPAVRVNALELGSILPGEAMSKEQREKKSWTPVTEVTGAMLALVLEKESNGVIRRVG